MGLACSKPSNPAENYKISYYAPQPRAVVEVVDFKDYDLVVSLRAIRPRAADDADSGDVHSGFLERDEGEREPPFDLYPWDGISGVKPFREFAASTTVGVY